MIDRSLQVVVPGSLDQRTGGYLYDARVVSGLRDRGWRVTVHEVPGTFPGPDAAAARGLADALAGLSTGARVVVDGLALGAHPEAVTPHAHRLAVVALVHHPLAEETGHDEGARARYRGLETRALAVCRGVVVTSAFTATRLSAYGVSPTRVRVVRPGVERAPLARGVEPGQPVRLLSVGSVTPRKGMDVLVRALERLRDQRWEAVLAGSLTRAADHAEEVRALVRRLGLDDRVRLTGEVDAAALDDLYDRSTLFVLASHHEGYGMVLTEALARGLPIVSTTAGAIPETVPPDASLLVPPGDDRALARALARALEPRRLAALREAARRHAGRLPGWEQTVRAFEAAILELGRASPVASSGEGLPAVSDALDDGHVPIP